MRTTTQLTDRHRQVLVTLADEGTIDDPDRATVQLLDDLIEAGLVSERPRREGARQARGPFSPTRQGRAMAVRFS